MSDGRPDKWSFVVPGQPPSGGHMYHIVRGYRHNAEGSIPYSKIAKTPEVTAYQQQAALIIRAARPSGWRWDGKPLRLTYRAFLRRNIDCDNISKVLGDAIKGAIDVDDSHFLICFTHKGLDPANPRVEVSVGVDAVHCHACGALLGQGRSDR